MDALRDLFQRKWIIAAAALIAGVSLGILYGYVINPVKWVDGTPRELRADLRQDYLRMVIDSYSVNLDAQQAFDRYQELGEFAAETLAEVGAQPGEVDPTAIQRFRAAVEILEPEAEAEEAEAGGLFGGASLLLYFCAGTAVLGVALLVVLLVRRRMAEGGARPREEGGLQEMPGPAELGYETPEGAEGREPLATFRTTYTLGDDLYDDSFSIETPAGDFVGECGVGIGDLIGVGEPKKVSAFEIWLFDKNDIQTVTKVLMSRYAHNDEATRNRLAAKGDPIEAQSGGVVLLETASLEVEARIVDMVYGEGALPPGSYFERVTIELRAWPRAGGPL
jgi:hypothetical protein